MCRPSCSPLFPYTTLFRSQTDTLGGTSIALFIEEAQEPVVLEVVRQAILGRHEANNRKIAWRTTSRTTGSWRSEEHTSELQSLRHIVCRLLLEKKKK